MPWPTDSSTPVTFWDSRGTTANRHSMELIRDGRFFVPGPTEVHARVLEAMRRPLISHRGPEMEALLARVQHGLREVLSTDRPVWVSTSSATALMEAGVRGTGVRRVLCLVGGAFSERFARISERSGLEVHRVEVPWGRAHEPGVVAEAVAATEPQLVTMVHSETSTGVLNPVRELVEAVRGRGDPFVVVDSVSGAGGVSVRPGDWGVDLLLTGAQKAFALPPGLAFGVASERLVETARGNRTRGLYLDVAAHYDALDQGKVLTTPAVSLFYALDVQLERMRSEGLEARFRRHEEMAADCYAWSADLREVGVGIEEVVPRGSRSPTVTVHRLPSGMSSAPILDRAARAGYIVASGYGAWRDEHIRIGHMGDHSREGLAGLLGVLREVLLSSR